MSDKPKSASSNKSGESVASVGIGTSEASVRLKIIPDGLSNIDDRLYDCMVLLIYCGQHRKVATVNTRREHIVWAPFMQLRDSKSWTQGTLDCIQRAIGRQDAELDEIEASKHSPKFNTTYFDVTEIQVPSVNSITRICQLVTLESGPYECCVNTRTIEWIPLVALTTASQNQYSNHWGPSFECGVQSWRSSWRKAA